ncbi:hypothetical protein GMRT_13991 [Giardia muris]|uniref:Uncharacterized protein n=1 Tax=Giardia muris TaxID=5742 RepID=A0A4Z1T6B5_GIAMU|nr:hypothetical protein GMRT_13991 [Giardia muris]|eukprot:TNJ29603.1 hypothetical protein GMRT_13991 [Giardia muris]
MSVTGFYPPNAHTRSLKIPDDESLLPQRYVYAQGLLRKEELLLLKREGLAADTINHEREYSIIEKKRRSLGTNATVPRLARQSSVRHRFRAPSLDLLASVHATEALETSYSELQEACVTCNDEDLYQLAMSRPKDYRPTSQDIDQTLELLQRQLPGRVGSPLPRIKRSLSPMPSVDDSMSFEVAFGTSYHSAASPSRLEPPVTPTFLRYRRRSIDEAVTPQTTGRSESHLQAQSQSQSQSPMSTRHAIPVLRKQPRKCR